MNLSKEEFKITHISKERGQVSVSHVKGGFVKIEHIKSGIVVTKYGIYQIKALEKAIDELKELLEIYKSEVNHE